MTASPDTEIQFEIIPSQTRMPAAERARILEAPGFGQVFTDHMITLRWSTERGWHDGKLEPYGPFTFDPATQVFHYGQELFEGLKAYRQDSGQLLAVVQLRFAAHSVGDSRAGHELTVVTGVDEHLRPDS